MTDKEMDEFVKKTDKAIIHYLLTIALSIITSATLTLLLTR